MDDEEEVINLGNFLDQWVKKIPESYFIEKIEKIEEAVMSQNMNQEPDVLSELAAVCDPNTLEISEEPISELEALCNVPEDTNLVTIKNLGKHKFKYHDTESLIVDYDELFYQPIKNETDSAPSDQAEDLKTKDVDLLLTVQIYDPYTSAFKGKPNLNQEFRVLGSQCLTELRDLISCASDFVIAGEFSENPTMTKDLRAKDIYRSGIFLIENTFYNDMRYPENRDYSQPIIKWSELPDVRAGPYQSKDMNDSHFIDLSIKLGQPYLYMHQGKCEHVFVFTDIRVIHESDGPEARFPIVYVKRRRNRTLCRGCQRLSAKWMVKGSPFSTDELSYFCEECLQMLHYDTNGKKICDFKAHVFVSNALF